MWHKLDYETKNAISCCQWKLTTKNIKHKTAYELEVSAHCLQDTSQDSAFYTPWDDMQKFTLTQLALRQQH